MSEPSPTILPTRATEVASAALAGGLVAVLAFGGLVRFGQSLPLLGPLAWLSVAVCAAAIGVLAIRTRRAVQKRREPIDPRRAVNRLLLGKTALLAGSFLGAAYVGLVAVAAQGWPAPLAQERMLHGGLAAVACVVLAVVGRVLENACRIPPDGSVDDTARGDGSDKGPEVP